MRTTLWIGILFAWLPVFGQGARTLLFDRTNLLVAVPETGFFDSNRIDIGNALKNPAIVGTMDELRARIPRTNEVVGVRGYSASVPWPEVRFFYHDNASSATRDGVHTETNAAGSGRYLSLDSRNPRQRVEWWGAYGAAKDGANIVGEQESQFTDLTRDAAWLGYGDARRVLTDPGGSNATYGLASFPVSPSAGPNASMDGFIRAPGLATVPPAGALSLRLTRRGHGYTNAQESVTVALSDGAGVPASYTVEIASGWADGYFNGGGFRLVSQTAGGSGQTMVLSYYPVTNAPLGGLKRPLVSGRTYSVSITANHVSGTGSSSSRQLWIGSSSSASVTITPNTTPTTYTGTFVADDDDLRIGLVGSTSAGEAFLLDDIVIREGTLSSDPSHEGDKIQSAINWAVGGEVVFPMGRKFVSTNGFILRGGQHIVGNGAAIEISVTDGTRQDGFQILSDGCSIEDLEIDYLATTPIESGGEGAQQIIGIGHFQFEDYPVIRNTRLENLTLRGYGASQWPQAINVGAASGVVIRNITIPDNSGLYQAIGVYWSGDLVQSVGTVHPQNVLIENVDIGRMTGLGPGSTGANGITIAGARNVQVRNLRARSVTGNFVRISGGDINYQRAKAEDGGAGVSGIVIDGATCLAVGRYGFRVQTLAAYSTTNTPIIASNVVVTVDTTNNRILWPSGTNVAPDGAIVRFSGTSAPSGISLATDYWVTWSGPVGFKLRTMIEGSGNEEAIDLGAGATNLIATVRRGQEFQPLTVTARNLDIKSSNGTYDGIYPDGAQDILIERARVRGFQSGLMPDYTTPNRRITVRDSIFTGNRGNGIQLRSGYDIAIERCVIEGNGIDNLSADENAGIWVRNGDRITIQGNQLGQPTGETTQRVGLKIENDNLDLRGVTIRDNAFLSASAAHHAELNTPSVAWPHTFNVVTGNKWFASTTTSNLWQSTASLYTFPGLRAGDSEAQAIRFGSSLALDLLAQRVMIGADDSSATPGSFTRTDNTDKIAVLQVPPYESTNTPSQFMRVDSKNNSITLATYGYGGSDNRSTTKFLIGTAISDEPGAAITNIGVFDSSHRIRLGPAGNEQTDTTAGVALEGPLPLRIHRMTTAQKNALTKASGLILYDSDLATPYWSDGTNWNAFGSGSGGGATNTTGTGDYVLSDSPTVTGNWVFDELTVGTFTVSTNLYVAEVAYGAGWNGSSNVPTRNAVYDAIVAQAATPSGVTAGTYTNSILGNTLTVGTNGLVTSMSRKNPRTDFHAIEEFVGPTTYSLFVGTANSGAAAAGTSATTPTNIFGMYYISTTGSNQFPQALCSVPFQSAGTYTSASLSGRFMLPSVPDSSDTFEPMLCIAELGSTTNKPVNGFYITLDSNLGSGNFFLVNATNSTVTAVDTGVAPSAGAWNDWTIRVTPTASIAYNGTTAVATNTGSYPGSKFLPSWGLRAARYKHTAAATRFVYIDKMELDYDSGR